jgi:hypothetical protein
LDEVKQKYRDDDNMTIDEWGAIVFTVGEHPTLLKDGHFFRRFSAKISGSHCGNVGQYLDEVLIIAKRHFGTRVCFWSEYGYESEPEPMYGWREVYDARDLSMGKAKRG